VLRFARLPPAPAHAKERSPEGTTGLLVRDYKGKNADVPFTGPTLPLWPRSARFTRQAAEELGHWAQRATRLPSTRWRWSGCFTKGARERERIGKRDNWKCAGRVPVAKTYLAGASPIQL
jgi:hypothetical protein